MANLTSRALGSAKMIVATIREDRLNWTTAQQVADLNYVSRQFVEEGLEALRQAGRLQEAPGIFKLDR